MRMAARVKKGGVEWLCGRSGSGDDERRGSKRAGRRRWGSPTPDQRQALLGVLVVLPLFLALCCFTGSSAIELQSEAGSTSSDGAVSHGGRCKDRSLIELVTQCAKRSDTFLKCVTRGNQGSLQQCACIQQDPEIQGCLAECLDSALAVLCSRSWTPRSSKYLEYAGQREALEGVDGIYVINLPRRRDRLARFLSTSPFSTGDFHLVSAFDGRELTWEPSLQKLFGSNKFKWRRAVVGQALSHYQLWRHIAESTDEFHLILEDDVAFTPGFVERWNTKMQHAFPLDAQIVFLGGLLDSNRGAYLSGSVVKRVSPYFSEHLDNTYFTHDFDPAIEPGEKDRPSKAFHYKPVAYILSSKGAKDLVAFVKQHGFAQPVGVMLMKLMRQWENVYATFPLVAVEDDINPTFVGGIDSDIQFDLQPVSNVSHPNDVWTTPPTVARQPPPSAFLQPPPPSSSPPPTSTAPASTHPPGIQPTSPPPSPGTTSSLRAAQPTAPRPSSTPSMMSPSPHERAFSFPPSHPGSTQTATPPAAPTQQHGRDYGGQARASAEEGALDSSGHDVRGRQVQTLDQAVYTFGDLVMPVAVINLPSSPDRLARFRAVAEGAKLLFYVHQATDARQLSRERLLARHLMSEKMPAGYLGTVAQTLSHLLLMEKLAKTPYAGALIFEDDALFNANLPIALSQLLGMAPEDWDVISLGCDPDTCGGSEKISDWYFKPQQDCDVNSVAYVVRRSAAATIMQDLLPVGGSIGGAFVSDPFVTKYNVYCLDPRVVVQQRLRSDRRSRDTALTT